MSPLTGLYTLTSRWARYRADLTMCRRHCQRWVGHSVSGTWHVETCPRKPREPRPTTFPEYRYQCKLDTCCQQHFEVVNYRRRSEPWEGDTQGFATVTRIHQRDLRAVRDLMEKGA